MDITTFFFRPLRVKGPFCALTGRAAFLFRRNPMESGQYRHDNNDSRLRQQREPHRIWHRKRHDDIHVGLPQPPLDDRLFNDLHIQL